MAQKQDFLGLEFETMSLAEAVRAVADLSARAQLSYVVTPNVDHLVRLHREPLDTALWQSYAHAALVLCDSQVLGLLARWSGLSLAVVPGSDLTMAILRDPDFAGATCHVVGGSAAMLHELIAKYPQFAWSQEIPPLNVMSDPAAQAAIVETVARHGADVTFFAIGSPQSELLCSRLSQAGLGRGVALCIGASLEFAVGTKRRAPRGWQALKLEWLFRLLSEPRRLWRRYLVTGPGIFLIWLRGLRRPP